MTHPKKLGLKRLKKRAPKIPEFTCTEIDDIIERLEKASEKSKLSKLSLKILIRKLERLRNSNDMLRESGVYWYNICKVLLED